MHPASQRLLSFSCVYYRNIHKYFLLYARGLSNQYKGAIISGTTKLFYSSPGLNKMSTSDFVIPDSVPVSLLDCTTAFNGLTSKEKKYAHYLSNACNEGALIVLLQTSQESPAIFMLMQLLFSEEKLGELKERSLGGGLVSDGDFQALLTYAAGFYANMGNYKSFGDTKIIPGISQEKLKSIILASNAYKKNSVLMEALWSQCSTPMYSLNSRVKELGLGDKGVSTYYSSNITESDISFVNTFMEERKLSPYNTRLFKLNENEYELCLASVEKSEYDKLNDDPVLSCLGKNVFNSRIINVTRGDYSNLLRRVVNNLAKAKDFAANEHEEKMIFHYMNSFQTGSINAHKDGSRSWVKDKGPIVENYIGFIESYRDPYGVRGEFEGFVSVVNKEMSKKFGVLVEQAEDLLRLLPWPASYEKDHFLRPDFTSLDVLIFAGSGPPAGINIPNYDDIRQNEGFKNVSLGNVLQARSGNEVITFLSEADQELYRELKSPSFEVQVGLHELLGHGSGKLFQEEEDGKLNFDVDKVLNAVTQQPIKSWYKHGETWDSKFSSIASTYEECRAECVGIYLSLDANILKIFGHEGTAAEDITYINWLNMVRAGLLGLEFYSPENKAWKQAHMNARYVIMQVLREAGNNFLCIEETKGSDGLPDLKISLDRSKINTVGRSAIGNFLVRLQVYKSTADLTDGQKMYQNYSNVDEQMLEYRKIVVARKQPRRMYAQCNTELHNDEVRLHEYSADTAGLIESFVNRYLQYDKELEELWKTEQKYHTYSY